MTVHGPERRERPLNTLKRVFEYVLWNSRLAVLVAVVFGVLLSLGALYLATADVVYALGYLIEYTDPTLSGVNRESLRADAITAIVKAVDGYLIAAILIIFALGLYELFISKLDAAERSDTSTRLLLIRDLDELKERIASLVLLVLVIEFFQRALKLSYDTPLDLLYFATGVLLVSGALYLGAKKLTKKPKE